MKTRKHQIIALVLASIALFGLGCKKADNANKNVDNSAAGNKNTAVNFSNTNSLPANSDNVSPGNVNSGSSIQPANTAGRGKSDVEKIARFFTEFFGSYSTDSNYGNVTGLKIYMTQNMQKWADTFVAEARKNKIPSGGYFGVTTKAVSVKTNSFSDEQGKAEVTVSCQRREATGTSTNARIYYQDMNLKFLKEKGMWKVDEAKWK